jgi:putative addiction module component (TIGR02574 family)
MLGLSEQIFEQALHLSVDERLQLADKLLGSVHVPSQEIEQAWLLEVECRRQELDCGESTLVMGDAVIAKVRERFAT